MEKARHPRDMPQEQRDAYLHEVEQVATMLRSDPKDPQYQEGLLRIVRAIENFKQVKYCDRGPLLETAYRVLNLDEFLCRLARTDKRLSMHIAETFTQVAQFTPYEPFFDELFAETSRMLSESLTGIVNEQLDSLNLVDSILESSRIQYSEKTLEEQVEAGLASNVIAILKQQPQLRQTCLDVLFLTGVKLKGDPLMEMFVSLLACNIETELSPAEYYNLKIMAMWIGNWKRGEKWNRRG